MKSLAPLVPDLDSTVHFWIGYRLLDFDADDMLDSLKPAWLILTQPSFFLSMERIMNWVDGLIMTL